MELIEAALRGALHPAWLAGCEAALADSVPGYSQKPRQEQLKLLLQQCLHCDLNLCGSGALPAGVQELHGTQLRGRFLLQLDEVINIAAPAKQRYSQAGGAGSARCLKLLLTDGVQQVAGLEYQFIPRLAPFMPAGSKVLVYEPTVRRGVLLLTPANLVVLGGRVERLEQARQKMVEHWNQPAVGRRGPPARIDEATQQARAAAWGPDGGNNPPLQHLQQQQAMAQPQQQQQQGMVQPQQQQQQVTQQQQQQQVTVQQQHAGVAVLAQQQGQQQWQQPAPQPALAAVRQQLAYAPMPSGSGQRQPLHLPPPPQQAAGQRQQLQQQLPPAALPMQVLSAQQRALSSRSGASQHVSAGSVAARPHLPAAGGSKFSIGAQGSPRQEQSGSLSLQSGLAGTAQHLADSGLPLQPVNQIRAGASGQAKRSRLQLRRPPADDAGDFSFVQPAANQQVQQPAQPVHEQRLQGSGQTAEAAAEAAGTHEDPIVVDMDGGTPHDASRVPMEVDVPSPQVPAQQPQQQKGADDPAWSDVWNDWEEPAPEGPKLEPYEVGFDEAEGDAAELDPGGEAAAEVEEWEADEEWDEDATGGWDEGTAALPPAADDGAAGAEQPVVMLVEAPQEEKEVQGTAVTPGELNQAAGKADMMESSGLRQSAAACEPALGRAAQRNPAHSALGASNGEAIPQRSGEAKSRSAGRKRQVVVSDDEEHDVSPGQQLFRAAAAANGPEAAHLLKAPPMASGAPAVPLPELGMDMKLQPLDDLLLKPAPSLADLMRQPVPSPATAMPLPGPPAQVPSMPATTSALLGAQGAAPLKAETPATAAVASVPLRTSGGKPPGGTLHRVSGGVRSLQLRASVRTGTTSITALAPPTWPAPHARQVLGHPTALQPPEVVALVVDSDDDVPVFDGLVDEAGVAMAGAGLGPDCGGGSEEEPFTYLSLLADRARAAGAGSFPITARIFGLVKTMVGKMSLESPKTGDPEYIVEMLVEDGSMVCRARLGNQFLRDLFDCGPGELKQRLSNPDSKQEAMDQVKTLQRHLANFSGLMQVQLAAPGATLEVLDLEGGLSPAQVAALQARCMS